MCPMCDCEEVAWAGCLGSLLYGCCRCCGWVYQMGPTYAGDGACETATSVEGDKEVSHVGGANQGGNPGGVQ
jgi:hypothetical protein